jgi:serine/threonine protein kinase/outer membrane protein assembly factor BamB
MERYKLLEQIGSGAWSTVHRAVDAMTDQTVAVKVFDAPGHPKRELRTARAVTHPNVVRVYDYFENPDGSRGIAMEYLDGGTLGDLMKRGPLPFSKAMPIADEILDGLEAIHSNGIIHQDLKPENILLTRDGHAKVSDFGQARPIDTAGDFDTVAGGTPAYRAPEQGTGSACDARADLFSFGLLFGQMLSGSRPRPPAPLQLPSKVPAQVNAAIERCLEMDRDKRFASVHELREALHPLQSSNVRAALLAASCLVIIGVAAYFRFSVGAVYDRPPSSIPRVAAAKPDPPKPTPPPGHSPEAFQAFSKGLYYIQNDLPSEALQSFDQTLALDPEYPGANHYRGVALSKLNRLDEAIDAFKRALPQSEPERVVSWSFDPMVAAGAHGVIRVNNTADIHLQRDLFSSRTSTPLQRVIYAERDGNSTILQFVNLGKHTVQRVEVADANILLAGGAYGNTALTVLLAVDLKVPPTQRRIGFYAFSNDSRLLWHTELQDYGNALPLFAAIGDAFYIYSPALRRFDLLDGRTGNLVWRREGLAVDGIEAPWTAHTKAYGDIFIVKSENTYRAMRKSDGNDVWTVPVQSAKASELLTEKGLVVFEPERRIFTVDLETGKTAGEIAIEQYVDVVRTPLGPKWLVGAMAQGNILYILSKDLEFCALDLARSRILWRAPLQKKVQRIRVYENLLYLATEAGEAIVLDTATGAVRTTIKVADAAVLLDHAGGDGLLMRANNMISRFKLSGAKTWEYGPVAAERNVTVFERTAIVYTSPTQLSALDLETGKVLWQFSGSGTTDALANAGRLFIVDDTGVKEYRMTSPPSAVTDKGTLIELAQAYLAKRDVDQARVFVDKAGALDPDDPPLVLVRARLLKAEGNTARGGKELARYVDLVGIDSKEGRGAIAELKRDYGLLWEAEVGREVAGQPVLIGNRLVSVGRNVQDPKAPPADRSIVALDPETGGLAWRFVAERFAASTAVTDGGPYIWYVAGSQSDTSSVLLYRIDIRSGERKQMASWRRPQRVDQAWIAYASGRIFVATVSPDLNTGILQLDVDSLAAASGRHEWTHHQTLKVGAANVGDPIRLFSASETALTYSIGSQTWSLRASDGAVLPTAVAADKSASSAPSAAKNFLWPPSGWLLDGHKLFAVTPAGHAYAMTAN